MPKSGVYETIYGNACEYTEGDSVANDLDSREMIPLTMVDFARFVRETE